MEFFGVGRRKEKLEPQSGPEKDELGSPDRRRFLKFAIGLGAALAAEQLVGSTGARAEHVRRELTDDEVLTGRMTLRNGKQVDVPLDRRVSFVQERLRPGGEYYRALTYDESLDGPWVGTNGYLFQIARTLDVVSAVSMAMTEANVRSGRFSSRRESRTKDGGVLFRSDGHMYKMKTLEGMQGSHEQTVEEKEAEHRQVFEDFHIERKDDQHDVYFFADNRATLGIHYLLGGEATGLPEDAQIPLLKRMEEGSELSGEKARIRGTGGDQYGFFLPSSPYLCKTLFGPHHPRAKDPNLSNGYLLLVPNYRGAEISRDDASGAIRVEIAGGKGAPVQVFDEQSQQYELVSAATRGDAITGNDAELVPSPQATVDNIIHVVYHITLPEVIEQTLYDIQEKRKLQSASGENARRQG